ncbi:hypothetical protein IWW35_001328 [Coemansia sp. RSA 1878]|nr:hypothetical protein IWW35_001328 [Coemansia sp. RSA 1878]
MFPDLPAKYEEANIEAATETLTRLCDFVTKMTVQCAAIKTSATELASLHQQTTNDTESPFLYFTLEQYATLAHNVHALYEQATQERQTYIDDLNEIIQSLRGESTDIPERAFDSDAHFVRLLAWESSPGLKNAQMSVPSHTTILSLADFDELAQKEFE